MKALHAVIQACGLNRDAYIHLMARQDGYVRFCKTFYEVTGWLTQQEVDDLYSDPAILPSRVVSVISRVEQSVFGQELIPYA